MVKMARASRLATGLRTWRDSEVGRPKQGEQSPLRRTDLRNDPSTLVFGKSSPFAGGRWNGGLGPHRQARSEAPTSPSLGCRRHRVLGISGGGEHAPPVHRSTDDGTRVLRSGITGPCCSPSQDDELPSSPSKPDHRPCSRHRKVRHVAREGRCGEERQTAWLFALGSPQGAAAEQRGQGRQPRTEEDRRLAGVPACRNRVAEIGSRNRGSEKRIGGPLRRTRGGRRSVRRRELDLEVAISDLRCKTKRPSASSDRAMIHRTNPLQLVGLAGRFRMVSNRDR